MTISLDKDTVEACQLRDGSAADGRDDSIDDALQTEKLGYGKGEPLIDEPYQDYPSKSDISNPSQGEFLRELLSHPLVSSLSDAVEELTAGRDRGHLADWLSTLEAATEVHGLDIDTLTSKGSADEGGDDPLTVILGYKPPDSVVTVDNPLLIGGLYQEGLSVEEISELLGVKAAQVRDTLKEISLLEGQTRTEQREAFDEKDGKIGGMSIDNTDTGQSGGLTVNAEDFA